jgi:hypothetical protein
MPSAFMHTPGAIDHYVRLRQSIVTTSQTVPANTWLYLGTAVTAPEPETENHYIDVLNDLAGRSVPFQLVYDGQSEMVITSLNRFSYSIYQAIKSMKPGGIGTDGGLQGAPQVGRGVLVIGNYDFELVLVNTYYATQAALNINNPGDTEYPAARYYKSVVLRKDKESTVGTRVTEVALMLQSNNAFNSTDRTFTIGNDLSMSALAALNLPNPN